MPFFSYVASDSSFNHFSASQDPEGSRILTCNSLPDLVEGLHAGDAHAATAAPSPSSAALQTERAWPGAGEQQTSEESGPAALEDMQLLRCPKI